MNSSYLTASELAELVDCKPNQRKTMCDWLDAHNWKYETSLTGLPKVARAFHDRKMGVTEERTKPKHADSPNINAFA